MLLWHDGRFMRHTRFRYWLLDTILRLQTPTLKTIFFNTRKAAADYTLGDLEKKDVRQNLVQQMSASTRNLRGTVGERRKMRQELESMVHQIEAESADRGENAGQGRIPAAFCTLTCAVYKWEQLHSTILKSCRHGQSLTADAEETDEDWRRMPVGSPEREEAMKRAFYIMSVQNPGIVAWYCGLKLEMSVHLLQELMTRMLQSEVVPGGSAARMPNPQWAPAKLHRSDLATRRWPIKG